MSEPNAESNALNELFKIVGDGSNEGPFSDSFAEIPIEFRVELIRMAAFATTDAVRILLMRVDNLTAALVELRERVNSLENAIAVPPD